MHSPIPDTKSRDLNGFDFLRLVAALAVVVQHSTYHLNLPFFWLHKGGVWWFYDGVPLFFIISGFFVYRSCESCIRQNRPLAGYFRNRLLRICPGLYFYGLAMPVLLLLTGIIDLHVVASPKFSAWLGSIFLLAPVYNPPFFHGIGIGVLNGSLWTIPVEVSFYCLVPLLIVIAAHFGLKTMGGLLAVLAVTGALLHWRITAGSDDNLFFKLAGFTFWPHLPFFALGIFWSHYWQRVPKSTLLAFGTFLAYVGLRALEPITTSTLGIFWGIPLSYFAMWVGFCGPSILGRISNRIGDLSYGVYIWHMVIVNLFLLYEIPRKLAPLPGTIVVLSVVIISMSMAVISWWMIEKPLLSRKKFSSRPSVQPPATDMGHNGHSALETSTSGTLIMPSHLYDKHNLGPDTSEPSESILFIGAIPQPNGGVTQHVWRLALRLAGSGCAVCDLHPSEAKYEMPGVPLYMAPKSRWKKISWLMQKMRRSPARILHLHASRSQLLGLCGPLLLWAGRGKFRVLTLHHGDQEKCYLELSPWRQRMTRRAISRFECVVCLSEKQRTFYESVLNVSAERLYDASSYVALPDHVVQAINREGEPSRQDYGDHLLLASGYATPLYQHEQAIQLVEELRMDADIHLALCLYGQVEDPAYLAKVKEMAASRPWVHITFDLDFFEFTRLLKKASLLLRPTLVDSYGLVVADAIALGVPAIASDVCRRHPAAILVPAGDYESLRETTRNTLDNLESVREQIRQQQVFNDAEPAVALYDEIRKRLPRDIRTAPAAAPSGNPAITRNDL